MKACIVFIVAMCSSLSFAHYAIADIIKPFLNALLQKKEITYFGYIDGNNSVALTTGCIADSGKNFHISSNEENGATYSSNYIHGEVNSFNIFNLNGESNGLFIDNAVPLGWSPSKNVFYYTNLQGTKVFNIAINTDLKNNSLANIDNISDEILNKFTKLFKSHYIISSNSGWVVFVDYNNIIKPALKREIIFFNLESGLKKIIQFNSLNYNLESAGVNCKNENDCIYYTINVPQINTSKDKYKVFIEYTKNGFDFTDRYTSNAYNINIQNIDNDGVITYLARGSGYREGYFIDTNGYNKAISKNSNIGDISILYENEKNDKIAVDYLNQTYKLSDNEWVMVKKLDDENTSLEWVGHTKRNGDLYILLKDKSELQVVSSNNNYKKYSNILCSNNKLTQGEVISTSYNNKKVYGVWYPSTKNLEKKKMIVLNFHGGPYENNGNWSGEGDLVTTFLKNGYDVIDVKYSGTPGYGDEYVSRPFGKHPEAIDEAFALRSEIEARYNLNFSKTYLSGTSFGGLIIKKYFDKFATSNPSKINGALLINPACSIPLEWANKYDYRSDSWRTKFLFDMARADLSLKDFLNSKYNACKRINSSIPIYIAISSLDPILGSEGISLKGNTSKLEIIDTTSHVLKVEEQTNVATSAINFWQSFVN